LRVVRTLTAEALDQPLVIRTVYNRISDVADWELYGESQLATLHLRNTQPERPTVARGDRVATSAPDALRDALGEWIRATNNRDIEKQMSFYVPRLRALLPDSQHPREFVRDEKARVFASASGYRHSGRRTGNNFSGRRTHSGDALPQEVSHCEWTASRRGEVIQELRWHALVMNGAYFPNATFVCCNRSFHYGSSQGFFVI
jgi:hypothetical protein